MFQTFIATTTVGAGGAASITFSSIPQTFTDLVLVLSTRSTSGSDLTMTFNANGTGYSRRLLIGDGSTTISVAASNNFFALNGNSAYTASTFGNNCITIPNYTGSGNKTLSTDGVNENNATTALQVFYAGLWSNTAAITSIELGAGAGNFAQFSTATLYGTLKGSGGATIS
jgi:hypothetical protein